MALSDIRKANKRYRHEKRRKHKHAQYTKVRREQKQKFKIVRKNGLIQITQRKKKRAEASEYVGQLKEEIAQDASQ